MKVLKGIICLILSGEWLGDDDAYVVERAADPLHRPGIDSKPFGDDPVHPAFPGVARASRIRFSSAGAIGGRPRRLPSLLARASPARTRSAIIARARVQTGLRGLRIDN
jgi:hypothetical protein